MPKANITISCAEAQELSQIDPLTGYRAESPTKFLAAAPVYCSSDEIRIAMWLKFDCKMEAVVNFPKSRRLEHVVGSASQEAIHYLIRLGRWDIYSGEEFEVTELHRDAKAEDVSAELIIPASLAEQLQEETSRWREARKRYDHAKQFLEDRARSNDFRFDKGEVRSAARFIVSCMKKSADPFLGGWNQEKSAGLEHAIDELLKRKDSSHPNFIRYCDKVGSVLYSSKFPRLWSDYPPIWI